MASSRVSATAFVVNLPKLKPEECLYTALSEDEFPADSLVAATFFVAVATLMLRDLPEYVPTTSTATEEITEHTKMRVSNRVYIINVALELPEHELPFVQHWKYADGMPLRALVVTKAIHNLPETPARIQRGSSSPV